MASEGRHSRRENSRLRALRHRRLSMEVLEQRCVLSANLSASHGLSGVAVDTVGSRTSFRDLNISGYHGDPDVAALAFLDDYAEDLTLPSQVTSHLSVIDTKYGIGSQHAYFQQTHEGLPVHGSQITVSMNGEGHIQTVHTDFLNHSADTLSNQLFSAIHAFDTVASFAGVTDIWQPTKSELVWYSHDDPTHNKQLELTWRLQVHASKPASADLLALVSAVDGRIIHIEDRHAHANGTGNVFFPNPVQTQGSSVGLIDNGDANSPALEAQLQSVTLERLNSGTGRLIGEWVDTTLEGGRPTTPADEPTRIYEYDRSDDRFEEVMVYHIMDQVQEYIHSLGFDDDTGVANGIRDFPTRVSAHWDNDKNAFYSPFTDTIHFGDAGDFDVDIAEDGDVIVHEYGHGIQFDQNPNWGGGEMDTMGEGFGDYLAASFFADDGDPAFLATNAAAMSEWAFLSDLPGLRRVDGDKQYPGDLGQGIHADGEIWSAALWDIRAELGGPVTDQIVLESHFGLPSESLMPDGALAIITADANLNAGANETAIRTAFVNRGILRPADDVGNSPSNATFIGAPSSVSFITDYEDDSDYFLFAAAEGFTYEFQSTSTGDPNVTLFDISGVTQLGFDDNGGTGNNAQLLWTAPNSGLFYVNASGSIASESYTFTINTITTPADDHGDFPSTSTSVSNPGQASGNIEVAGDHDVFSFQAVAATAYEVETNLVSLVDATIHILDSNFDVVESDLNGGTGRVTFTAASTGTYYASVSGFAQGTYTLVVDEVADDHGNTASTATDVSPGSVISGDIEFAGDKDMFSVTTIAGRIYRAEAGFGLGSFSSSVLTLYASDGVTELESDVSGFLFGSTIEWDSTGGVFYLEVAGFDDADIGTYQFSVEEIVTQTDDHGDNAATATQVDPDSTTSGNLDFLDSDFFAVTVPGGTRITATLNYGSLPLGKVTLYDQNGTTILDSDDNIFDDPRVRHTVPTSGTYYIGVSSGGLSAVGTYTIRLSSRIPILPCDYVGVGNGCDINDLNALYTGTNGAPAPLTDALIGQWLSDASDPGNPLKPNANTQFVFGDVNLDGQVLSPDVGLLLNNFNDSTGLGWGAGNLNADNVVDSADLGLLLNNFNFTSQSVSATVAFANEPDDEEEEEEPEDTFYLWD